MIKKRILVSHAARCMILLTLVFTACPQSNDPRGEDDPGILTTLRGTKWLWGASLLEFDADTDTVLFRRNSGYPAYPYTVNPADRTGTITTLGDFTLSADFNTLEIINYRNNTPNDRGKQYNAVFRIQDPQKEITIPDTLVGTEWNLDDGEGERFFLCQWIIFFTGTEAVNRSGGGVFVDDYSYNNETKRGKIDFIGQFEIRENGGKLYIPSYKTYGHDMTCTRVQ